jgi:HAD superfamily hydrolase (TIGR01509 family)
VTKLVIFDHDGLMVNSEDVVFAAMQQLFGRYGHPFSWEYYCTTIGLPVSESIAIYLRDLAVPLDYDNFLAERNRLVGELLETQLQLMPGLLPLLEFLRERGIAMAVATSGTREYITRNLERFGIAHYFRAVVCIDDVRRGKPHPDLVLKALERTSTGPADALMLEDAPHGVEAAHQAGVFCVAVPTRGLDLNLFRKADVVARDLDAVRQMFAHIETGGRADKRPPTC